MNEEPHINNEGAPYYTLKATGFSNSWVDDTDFQPFVGYIEILSKTDPVVLELAATYDMYKEMNLSDQDAMVYLKKKKGDKCNDGRDQRAVELLHDLGLL